MLTRREMILGSTLAATAALAERRPAEQRKPTMYQAATDFLATLDADQKQKALLPFNSEERLNWHYVPMERKGLHLQSHEPRPSRRRRTPC